MAPIGGGSHFQGPVLGSDRAFGGHLKNLDIGSVSRMGSVFKYWYEDFRYAITASAAGTNLGFEGWTVTQLGAVAANTTGVTDINNFLLINAGTATQTGYILQHNAAYMDPTTATAVPIIPPHDVFGPYTPSSTSQANKEFIWATRIGFAQATSGAGSWSNGTGGGVLAGAFVTDATIIDPTLPAVLDLTIAAGGGVGFYINKSGVLWAVGGRAANQSIVKQIKTLPDVSSATVVGDWIELGVRITHGPTPTGNTIATAGYAEWFVNGVNVAQSTVGNWVSVTDYATPQVTNPLIPFHGATPYCTTYAVINGSASTAIDVGVDYVLTAISKPGVTRTSNP